MISHMSQQKKTNGLYPDFTVDCKVLLTDLQQLLDQGRSQLEQILTPPYSYKNTLEPFAIHQDTIAKFWSIISHLQSVTDQPELKKVYPEALSLLTNYQVELSHNVKLYEAFSYVLEHESKTLSADI